VPVERAKAGALDDLALERAGLLEQESAELEQQAERLADEIKELNGRRRLEFLETLFAGCGKFFIPLVAFCVEDFIVRSV
jgi:hypothetical protein